MISYENSLMCYYVIHFVFLSLSSYLLNMQDPLNINEERNNTYGLPVRASMTF